MEFVGKETLKRLLLTTNFLTRTEGLSVQAGVRLYRNTWARSGL